MIRLRDESREACAANWNVNNSRDLCAEYLCIFTYTRKTVNIP